MGRGKLDDVKNSTSGIRTHALQADDLKSPPLTARASCHDGDFAMKIVYINSSYDAKKPFPFPSKSFKAKNAALLMQSPIYSYRATIHTVLLA